MSTPPVAPDLSSPSDVGPPPADLAIGSFSNDPPWIVEPSAMPWREVVDSIRWLTRHDLPELTSARRLPDVRRAATVELDWDVRQKSRFDCTDSSGRALGVFLPRGTATL
jgi:hypothetical protein